METTNTGETVTGTMLVAEARKRNHDRFLRRVKFHMRRFSESTAMLTAASEICPDLMPRTTFESLHK
jgi:hypothetical protein